MGWVDVIWTDENEEHVRENRLTPEEVEYVLRNPLASEVSRSSGRPLAIGRTAAGREVVVVYEELDAVTVYPITAYDLEK